MGLQFPVQLGEATVTDILTNDEISLLRGLEKKSRTITGNFTHKRYDRLETEGYIKRSSQSPSMQDILYEALGGANVEFNVRLSESVLARLHFIIYTEPGNVPDYDLDQIEERVNRLSVPLSFADEFYGLRNHIEFVRHRLSSQGS